VFSSSSISFSDMSISKDLDRGVVFFKGSRTSLNNLESGLRARKWQFEERVALMEDPTWNNTLYEYHIIATLKNIVCKNSVNNKIGRKY
jgi:hypothetical protein